jgi:hypothetical protein
MSAKLAEILQSWPLYRRFSYIGKSVHIEGRGGMHGNHIYTFGLLPTEISLFCPGPKCKKEQQWHCGKPEVYFGEPYYDRVFHCKNCGKKDYTYFFSWSVTDEGGSFTKIGQFPPLETNIIDELERQLEPKDSEYYRKAMICRNSLYGLAALAYLRRVVEDTMNNLLDLVSEAAKASNYAADELSKIEEVKTNKRFDSKAEFAAKILPTQLKPGGHNPFDILHGLFSEGIHSMSEEECTEEFDRTRLVFEYLFKNLSVSHEEAKAYIKNLSQLSAKKSE